MKISIDIPKLMCYIEYNKERETKEIHEGISKTIIPVMTRKLPNEIYERKV